MNAIDKLNLVNRSHQTALQIAREDKPTGDYPVWCDAITEHFNNLARVYMSQAREEMGIVRAEQAVR